MAEVLAVIESAAKVTHIASVGTAPPWTHSIPALLAPQPESVRDAFGRLAGSRVDLDELDIWRQGSTYVDSRPELPSEQHLRDHCAAALDIAALAADRCRQSGISEAELSLWHQNVSNCHEVLDGAIRHQDPPRHSTDP